jgi:glutathione peroxidase
MTIYDVAIDGLTGSPADLDRYRGRVALVVNVASRGGMTPLYAGLQAPATRFGSQTDPRDGRLVAVIEKLSPR